MASSNVPQAPGAFRDLRVVLRFANDRAVEWRRPYSGPVEALLSFRNGAAS